ncbi:MAG: hypothetical protein JW829_21315, partial [Pirellulales bacterium]|nr:hypothetical protein [Pirellulales bacterium]
MAYDWGMHWDSFRTETRVQQALDLALGYINFSSGTSDRSVLRSLDDLYRVIEGQKQAGDTVAVVHTWLRARLHELHTAGGPFANIDQADAVLSVWWDDLIPKWEEFHHDLLFHQTRDDIWRPFFVGRAWETILALGPPFDDPVQLVSKGISLLNDYVGYRPVAILEDRACEPYEHERIRPIPLYIADVGVAVGRYEKLISIALDILSQTNPSILSQAYFGIDLLEELALDPR